MSSNADNQLLQQSRFPVVWLDLHAASPSAPQERGAVFTRPEVVEFILDLVGYTPYKQLYSMRLLEPSFGQGDFLMPIVDRLLASWRTKMKFPGAKAVDPTDDLRNAINGVELHQGTFAATREKVVRRLQEHSLSASQAIELADHWLIRDDFLLADLHGRYHFAVGNPPYVRQELVPDALMAEYRARYKTIYDRADLYIPFMERSLSLLERGGHLGFICADRWVKNRYGGPLRRMISEDFHLKVYVDMVDTPAFQSDVIAYPAITIIAREPGTTTRIAYRPQVETAALAELAAQLTAPVLTGEVSQVRSLDGVVSGAEPWVLGAPDQLSLVRRLEARFPTLEAAGCRVGIGVATGADKAFIAPYDQLDVEVDRKIPLVTTRDISGGKVEWGGLAVLNPFTDDGSLVSLAAYPRLSRYLEAHRKVIASRHIAKKGAGNWYRTIDRIYPALASTPKLLIPDIKGEAHVVYEEGKLYPHHNLYYITSKQWDLRALQAVLLSGIARAFISAY
jgi:hypothetical protein